MAMRLLIAAWLAAALLPGAGLGETSAQVAPQQKLETCNFGADSQKLTGAKRKSFMAKCMADKDSPRGKPVGPAPR